MLDILQYLPAKRKPSPQGWLSFNAICCTHNGNSADRRGRGGIKVTEQGWSYHCFNCSYTASFVLGRTVSFKAKKLLGWMGVPDNEIEMLNLESLRHRSIHGLIEDRQKIFNTLSNIEFEEFDDFPPFCEVVTPEYPLYWDYIRKRKVPEDFPVMTSIKTDGVHWTRPYVLIPFTYNDRVVGWTARFLDNKIPKYINHSQPGYVFGTDLQHSDWQSVIVTEGIFDALSINGLAVMHNTISDSQARLIRSLGREVIVVPDQDVAGVELIDRAVELGYSVSIPEWPEGCKDVNDAVIKLGRLGALLTIMSARETSRIKIELRKKQLVKRLRT
jgi:Toprim-like